MQVDLIGTQAVANFIRQSGLTKFVIMRYGAGTNAVPIYECLEGNQNKRAVDAFTEWAQNLLAGNPNNGQAYELLLFTNADDAPGPEDQGEDNEDNRKRGKAKKNKLRVYFSLANQNATPASLQGIPADFIRKDDMQKIISDALERNELIRANKELADRIKALEDGDDDDDEGEDEGEDLIGRVEKIFDKISMFAKLPKTEQAEAVAAVNGAPDQDKAEKNAQVKKNIQTAIQRLYKHNSQLDTDLLKLADIADGNPSQFTFFMNALRKM